MLHNQEAERALLGAMLLSNDKIPEIIERIPPRAIGFFHLAGGNGAKRRAPAELDEPFERSFALGGHWRAGFVAVPDSLSGGMQLVGIYLAREPLAEPRGGSLYRG